jgi:hypothetical protein
LENLKRRDHSEDLGIGGRILLEWILGNSAVQIGFIWLQRGMNGGLL